MRKVKARKEHICDCKNIIKKGDIYFRYDARQPKYNEADKQIGIEYVNMFVCQGCYSEMTSPPMTAEEFQDLQADREQ